MIKIRQKGFTLIELMIVLVIVGFLVGAAAQALTIYHVKQKEVRAEKTYDSIQEGLRTFILSDPNPLDALAETNNRYPCPASPSVLPYSATYGEELCPTVSEGECEKDVCVVAGTNGPVFIGAVPTKTLAISASNAIDPYGNRLTYAVSADLTVPGSLSGGITPAGSVTIDPTLGGIPISDAHFAIVMHGQDGAGSFTADGVRNTFACRSGEGGDAENCDGDAVFSELERSVGNTEDYYDDKVAFTLTSGSADAYWGPINNNPQNIHNLNDTGVVWIGPNPDPAAHPGDRVVVNGVAAVTGEIKLGNTGMACNVSNEGGVRYTGLNGVGECLLEVCDGVEWKCTGYNLLWTVAGYDSCSNQCGNGTQDAILICANQVGDQVLDEYCQQPKPAMVQTCTEMAGCCADGIPPDDDGKCSKEPGEPCQVSDLKGQKFEFHYAVLNDQASCGAPPAHTAYCHVMPGSTQHTRAHDCFITYQEKGECMYDVDCPDAVNAHLEHYIVSTVADSDGICTTSLTYGIKGSPGVGPLSYGQVVNGYDRIVDSCPFP